MLAFFSTQLQITDIVTALSSGNYFEIYLLAIFLSGYSFVALTSRETQLWTHTILFEKLLIGIGMGSALEALWFFSGVALYSVIEPSLSLLQIFGQTTILSCFILVAVPLFLKHQGIREHDVRSWFYYGTALSYYIIAFIALVFIWLFILGFSYPSLLFEYVALATGISGTFWGFSAMSWFGFSKAYKGFFHDPPLRENSTTEKKPAHETKRPNDVQRLLSWRNRNKLIAFIFVAGVVASALVYTDQ